MDKKTIGIISTVASALLCGCPGIFLCLFGAASALGAGTFEFGGQSGGVPKGVGVVLICLGLLLALIPVVVGFFTLRNKPAKLPDEPIPPAA
ncbi:MAG: hypothetical protein ACPL3P_08820 [Anaerolineales bacterium]